MGLISRVSSRTYRKKMIRLSRQRVNVKSKAILSSLKGSTEIFKKEEEHQADRTIIEKAKPETRVHSEQFYLACKIYGIHPNFNNRELSERTLNYLNKFAYHEYTGMCKIEQNQLQRYLDLDHSTIKSYLGRKNHEITTDNQKTIHR